MKRVLMLGWVLVATVIVVMLLVLLSNQSNLRQEPGTAKRLKIFLTTNRAEISEQPVLPELKSPTFNLAPEELVEKVISAMQQLGWRDIRHVRPGHGLRAIVVTPLMRFKDDIHVEVVAEGEGSRLTAVSQSRVGRADFAANSAHLQKLLAKIDAIITR